MNKRRRILRRWLRYGEYGPGNSSDDGTHSGIVMTFCPNLFQQFEFVLQQLIQYRLYFNVANDMCVGMGNHNKGDKFGIASDPEFGKHSDFRAHPLPFGMTKGGAYVSFASVIVLCRIALGVTQPTRVGRRIGSF
ncbi:MAG: hypothetical protein O7G83_22195 [Proteobacteria bacterium]|nr:hypothetical protein [Pseudomonadota bacterium]